MILDCIRLTTPPPPPPAAFADAAAAAAAATATSGTTLPHGFGDLDRPAVVDPAVTAASAVRAQGSGAGGSATAAVMQDPKTDLTFSPLEAVLEHLRGKRATSPAEITEAIVDGLSDVRKDVQAVASGLIE